MGQAFHRKRISIDRSGTRGIGFKYVDVTPPTIRELTPEQVAAREQEAQEQAALREQRRLQRESVDNIVRIAGAHLALWKDASDYDDQCLIEFAGWTRANYCTLPVDESIARFYVKQIHWYTSRHDNPLSLDELDEIVALGCKRFTPTEQVVKEATKAIRYVAQACADSDGVNVVRFIQALARRARRAKQQNNDIDPALAFVCDQMSCPTPASVTA